MSMVDTLLGLPFRAVLTREAEGRRELPPARRVALPDAGDAARRGLEDAPPAGSIDDAGPAGADGSDKHRREHHGVVISNRSKDVDKSLGDRPRADDRSG
jgi:hypothetical protein